MPTWTNDETGETVEFDNPKDLRNQVEEHSRARREAEERARAAEERAASLLEPAVRTALSDLPEGAARTWMLAHPGEVPTAEAKASFVTEFGYSPTPPAEPVEESSGQGQEQVPQITMQPTTDGQLPVGAQPLTTAQLNRLYRTNPTAARDAIDKGKVAYADHPGGY